MDKKYWNNVSNKYDEEIFNSLESDRNKIILKHINKFASKDSIAGDFGCGIGKYLPVLAKKFHSVYAIDLSDKCLKLAKKAHSHLDNITYIQGDLLKGKARIKKVDFGISANVIMMPSLRKRLTILDNLSKHIQKGGVFLLIVPSLESALYTDFRMIQWHLSKNVTYNKIPRAELNSMPDINNGMVKINGIPTKHYLKEELQVLLENMRFKIIAIEKVEYAWNTEFDNPPKWIKQPYPWDWLAVSFK